MSVLQDKDPNRGAHCQYPEGVQVLGTAIADGRHIGIPVK